MITYTYKNGKQHKHLIYSGGIRCLCCKPKKIKVHGDFSPRGGIKTEVFCKD